MLLLVACAQQPSQTNEASEYDQYTIDERLKNIMFRVNSLERGIYLIQKAVRDSQDWDAEKKRAICVAAGKTVRKENIDNMKVIMNSLADELLDMTKQQQADYREYRRRVWSIQPEQPLCYRSI